MWNTAVIVTLFYGLCKQFGKKRRKWEVYVTTISVWCGRSRVVYAGNEVVDFVFYVSIVVITEINDIS
jgi:hypothetical protein